MNQYELIHFCDTLLQSRSFKDYCPNGLQVEGSRKIKKIILGVSICEELIDLAIQQKGDMILTHHGLFWDKQENRILGAMKKKLTKLINAGIACAAYHLPLDFHDTIGNNFQLAKKLGLKKIISLPPEGKGDQKVGILGEVRKQTIEAFTKVVATELSREPFVLPYGPKIIQKVAITTGGGQGYFPDMVHFGADCFITGEVSEYNYSQSRELQSHFIAAGHYATEKYGVLALGRELEKKFGVQTLFIDIENPI